MKITVRLIIIRIIIIRDKNKYDTAIIVQSPSGSAPRERNVPKAGKREPVHCSLMISL